MSSVWWKEESARTGINQRSGQRVSSSSPLTAVLAPSPFGRGLGRGLSDMEPLPKTFFFRSLPSAPASCPCLLLTANCLLPTAFCPLPSAHCPCLLPLPSAYCPLPSAHCPLPSAHCLLPTAFCPLPSAHCSLLTDPATPEYDPESRARRQLPSLFPVSPNPLQSVAAVARVLSQTPGLRHCID